jgi:hypothetical protein
MAEPSISTASESVRITPEMREVLDEAASWEDLRLRAEAGKLAAAARFVELNSPDDLAGFEAARELGGVGAPVIPEYAIAAFSAALGISDFQARGLLSNAIEMKHRLPKLWSLVQGLDVPVWKVSKVCRLTRVLSPEAVLWVDECLAKHPGRIGTTRIERLVENAITKFDPVTKAARLEELRQNSRKARKVEVTSLEADPTKRDASVTKLEMVLDTPDAMRLDATINTLAEALAMLGSKECLNVRRALAAGMLADPAEALAMLNKAGLPTKAPVPTTLVVHFNANELVDGGFPVGFEETLGPVGPSMVRDWCGGGKVTIRPVINLADIDRANEPSVDQHDPTDEIKEIVLQRNAVCVYPGCDRDSRACDLDHINPYIPIDHGGQRGQTRPSNLAPLCRFHHRVKTHQDWSYRIDDVGDADWIAPDKTRYRKPAVVRRP